MMNGVTEFVNQNTFRSFKIVFVSFSFGCGNMQWSILFSWAPKSLQQVTAAMQLKEALLLGRKAMTNLDNILQSRHHFANKGRYSQSYGFFSSHVLMWEVDHKDSWVPKNWWFWIVMLETFESLLDSKEAKPVNPKGYQPWIFIARPNAKAETPTLWPPDAKSPLIGKDPDSGKDWEQKKRVTEGEMVR